MVEIPTGVELAVELIFVAGAATVLPTDVAITGGVRRPTVAVTHVTATGARLRVEVARRGDFSDYVLTIARNSLPLPGFDRLLSAITFGFRRQCDQPFDCEADAVTPAPPLATAAINYLARDYEGFRRLMLDRFAALVPGWRDSGPADPVVTLIEVFVSAADLISYQQDAAATEAYLDTARRRVSARRHARLVDYRMHEGRMRAPSCMSSCGGRRVRRRRSSPLCRSGAGS